MLSVRCTTLVHLRLQDSRPGGRCAFFGPGHIAAPYRQDGTVTLLRLCRSSSVSFFAGNLARAVFVEDNELKCSKCNDRWAKKRPSGPPNAVLATGRSREKTPNVMIAWEKSSVDSLFKEVRVLRHVTGMCGSKQANALPGHSLA